MSSGGDPFGKFIFPGKRTGISGDTQIGGEGCSSEQNVIKSEISQEVTSEVAAVPIFPDRWVLIIGRD